MVLDSINTHIAYRCTKCATTVYGFIGKFALSAGMVRLKCSCGESALDVQITHDKKLRLSVPCIFCGKNHSYTVTQPLFFGREIFLLNCPYSNMDIAFIGSKENVDSEAKRTEAELERLFAELEAENPSDIQPQDVDEEEVLPDPSIYDAIRFLIKDLESEGKVDCPCHKGEYDLRFCAEGIQVYCPDCGAVYTFDTRAEHACDDYLMMDSVTLS